MANDKWYTDYLMHGRTKGSRNGISTTKGYTAVGQRAKGHYVNGHYVYELGAPGSYRPQAVNSRNGRYTKKLTFDTPKSYGAHLETKEDTYMIRDGKYVYETPSVPAGVATYPTKKKDWAKEAASYDNHVSVSPQGGWDAEMLRKRSKWLSNKAQANGAARGDAQQANYAYERARRTKSNKPTNVGAYQAGNTTRAMTEYGNLMTARRKAKINSRYIDDEYSKNLEYNSKKNNFVSENARNKSYNRNTNVINASRNGARNNWQQQGNNFRAANEAWERYGSMKSNGITGMDKKGNYGGYGQLASLEGSTRAVNALSGLGKLRKEKKNLSLYGSGDTKTRNSRSDIANAFADAKADAKNAFKTMKQKALLSIFNKSSIGVRKDKKKKKSLKDFFK